MASPAPAVRRGLTVPSVRLRPSSRTPSPVPHDRDRDRERSTPTLSTHGTFARPAASSSSGTGVGMLHSGLEPIPRRREEQPLIDVQALEDEMDKLLATCDQHELKIRSARSGLEHRVFSEFPQVFINLASLDDRADRLTSDMYSTLQSVTQPLQSRLAELVDARSADVETMRERLTPWRSLLEETSEDGVALEEKDRGRIERVGTEGSSDGLGMIERWAEETEMHLTNEIVRLKALQRNMTWKRRLMFRASQALVMMALLLLAIGLASHSHLLPS